MLILGKGYLLLDFLLPDFLLPDFLLSIIYYMPNVYAYKIVADSDPD